MEFHEKLQELRKKRGLTQEELAQSLYVSRTAVSKWESGRGYPNLESLKMIARFFSVTVDDLLSGDEIVSIAEEDQKQKQKRFFDLVFGLLDLSVVMLLFLPFFGQIDGDAIYEVGLWSLVGVRAYLKGLFLGVVIATAAFGVLMLAMQSCRHFAWEQSKNKISLVLSAGGALLFAMARQPYAASFLLLALMIKALLLAKRQ